MMPMKRNEQRPRSGVLLPPGIPPAGRRGPGSAGAVLLATSKRPRAVLLARAGRLSLTRGIFRQRPRASSICSCTAGRAISRRLTPSPILQRLAGQPLPASFGPVATRRKVAHNPLLATKRKFRKCGQSGIEISDFLPHLSECADDLAVIRSCWADSVNHPQAVYEMNTGTILMGKPSLGSLGQLWPGYRESRLARRSWSCPILPAGSRAARPRTAPGFCRPATRER